MSEGITYRREMRPYPFDAPDIGKIEKASFSLPMSGDVIEEMMEKDGIYEFRTISTDCMIVSYMVSLDIFPEAEILRIGTLPEYRRKGYADHLIKSLLEEKKAERYTKIHLEVRESNFSARSLYEKNGFGVCGQRKGYYRFPSEDAVLMEKNLT